MGDLNATEQSKGIRNLIAALGLVDTFRAANPAAPGFTVWQPVWLERPFASRRVDFILLAPGANTRGRVVASRVVLNQPSRTQGRVLWPSDHYGVLSEVEILRRAGDGKARRGRARAPIGGVARSSSFGFRATTATWNALTFGGWVDGQDASSIPQPARPTPPRPSLRRRELRDVAHPPREDGRDLRIRLAALLRPVGEDGRLHELPHHALERVVRALELGGVVDRAGLVGRT